MKLSSTDIEKLSNILSTCAVGGVEAIIIESGQVRGVNESRTFAIISDHDIPKFSQTVGITRMTSLRQRLELFANSSSVNIEARESDRGEISSLDISAGKAKVQYRCTSTKLIKAPKSINDEIAQTVFFTKDEVKLLSSAIKIMGGKTVQLIIKKDGRCSIVANDATNDAFTSDLEIPAEFVSDDQDTVVHYYHADIFLAVLRSADSFSDSTAYQLAARIGAAGTLTTGINGHSVVVMPKVGEDSEEN